MSEQTAITLIEAITQRSLLFADNIGLDLTADEIERVFEAVGIRYFMEKVTEKRMPTVGDLLGVVERRGRPK